MEKYKVFLASSAELSMERKDLLSFVMPDWQERKKRLGKVSILR